MSKFTIHDVVIEPPPCEPNNDPALRCQHYDRCARELLACEDYNIYVHKGLIVKNSRTPTRKIFIHLTKI